MVERAVVERGEDIGLDLQPAAAGPPHPPGGPPPGSDGFTGPGRSGTAGDGNRRGALIAGLIGYDPTDHTSDYLMALWFAREGAVRYPCARALPEVGVETMAESPEERADREEREAFEQRRHRRAS